MRKAAITGFMLGLTAAGCGGAVPGLPALRQGHDLVVIAHRGDHLTVPENTLEAYRQAIEDGADYVEVDLRSTREGRLVSLHDARVDRMTGDTGAVSELPVAVLSRLALKPTDSADTGIYHIPEFSSILRLCRGRIHIYLDDKDADAAAAFRLIREAGMEEQVVVYLNQEEQYAAWQAAAPAMPLMASLPEGSGAGAADSFCRQRRIAVVDNAADAEVVRALHRRGVQVWLDVQGADEGPERWARALATGADGLQTDHPAALIAYLYQRGLR